MVKVSIIVPVYNVEKYLETCLDSLVNQTLKDVEIICVNDGSKDDSLLILQDYARRDSRIKVVNKENEGQSVARNIAIEMATGEYLGFVDSDDWVDSDYFEKLYNSAKKHDCDIACAGFKRCRKNKQRVSKSFEAELVCTNVNDKVRMDNLPSHNYIWNKIYRLSTWKDLGIKFTPKRFYEDMALLIQILHKMGKMVTVPGVYYYYRVNPESTVAQKSIKHSRDFQWAKNNLIKYAEENDIMLDVTNMIEKKEYFKIFNFTILKAYYYEFLVVYKLFGIIPVGKKMIV